MAGVSQDKLKSLGRNRARIANQRSSSQPTLNEHKGSPDGGSIGRGKSPRKTGVYRGSK